MFSSSLFHRISSQSFLISSTIQETSDKGSYRARGFGLMQKISPDLLHTWWKCRSIIKCTHSTLRITHHNRMECSHPLRIPRTTKFSKNRNFYFMNPQIKEEENLSCSIKNSTYMEDRRKHLTLKWLLNISQGLIKFTMLCIYCKCIFSGKANHWNCEHNLFINIENKQASHLMNYPKSKVCL